VTVATDIPTGLDHWWVAIVATWVLLAVAVVVMIMVSAHLARRREQRAAARRPLAPLLQLDTSRARRRQVDARSRHRGGAA